jgi:uncharacterized protein
MLPVVSNSSPLILFSRAGLLNLLAQLFAEVMVPQAVFDEVVTEGSGHQGAADIATATWLRRQPLADHMLAEGLVGRLGRGEAEAIALAMELEGKLPLLIDDRLGRKLAQERGLHVVGSAGILVRAKQLKLIPEVTPILDELLSLGLYLSDAARLEILAIAGEPPARDIEAR